MDSRTKGCLDVSFKSGFVSIVGRPNVGKSTLLNRIIGQKVAIVTPKSQTTRNRITGIKTMEGCQIIFVDTPGIHKPFHKLGELMVKSALNSVHDVDIVLYMVLPRMPSQDDINIIERIVEKKRKYILVINKVDTEEKEVILPIIEKYAELSTFDEIIPLSAKTGDGMDILLRAVEAYLPEGPKFYQDDMTTDQMERFIVGEIIREKIILETMDEIPYSVAVEVVEWDENAEHNLIRIEADIYVERESQKGIIIGRKGQMIKKIGSAARKEIEVLLGTRVFLSLRVKVKKDWRENAAFLREIGFN